MAVPSTWADFVGIMVRRIRCVQFLLLLTLTGHPVASQLAEWSHTCEQPSSVGLVSPVPVQLRPPGQVSWRGWSCSGYSGSCLNISLWFQSFLWQWLLPARTLLLHSQEPSVLQVWMLRAGTRTTAGLQAADSLPLRHTVSGKTSSIEKVFPGVLSLTCGLSAGGGSGGSGCALWAELRGLQQADGCFQDGSALF